MGGAAVGRAAGDLLAAASPDAGRAAPLPGRPSVGRAGGDGGPGAGRAAPAAGRRRWLSGCRPPRRSVPPIVAAAAGSARCWWSPVGRRAAAGRRPAAVGRALRWPCSRATGPPAAGGVDVVVGARAAAWAPSPASPRSSCSTSTTRRCRRSGRRPGTPATSASSGPAGRRPVPAGLARAEPRRARLRRPTGSSPSRTEERAGWPHRARWSIAATRTRGSRSLVTSPLIAELRDPHAAGGLRAQHHRAGPPPGVQGLPASCGCERCSTPVVRDREPAILRCARCGTERPVCQACGSSALSVLRPGVTRLREELEAAAGRPVVEVTAASPTTPDPSRPMSTSARRRCSTGSGGSTPWRSSTSTTSCWRPGSAPTSRRSACSAGPPGSSATGRGGRLLVQTRLPRPRGARGGPPRRSRPATGAGDARPAARARFPAVGALAVGQRPGRDEHRRRAARRCTRRSGCSARPTAAIWSGPLTPDALADGLAAAERTAALALRIEVDPPRV